MVITVLDASALLRFLLREPGGDRVRLALLSAETGQGLVAISAVNSGEVVGRVARTEGRAVDEALAYPLQSRDLEIVEADGERAARAALLRLDYKLPYADAFCVELAASMPNDLLITADFDFKPAADLVHIEFLPAKPTPQP